MQRHFSGLLGYFLVIFFTVSIVLNSRVSASSMVMDVLVKLHSEDIEVCREGLRVLKDFEPAVKDSLYEPHENLIPVTDVLTNCPHEEIKTEFKAHLQEYQESKFDGSDNIPDFEVDSLEVAMAKMKIRFQYGLHLLLINNPILSDSVIEQVSTYQVVLENVFSPQWTLINESEENRKAFIMVLWQLMQRVDQVGIYHGLMGLLESFNESGDGDGDASEDSEEDSEDSGSSESVNEDDFEGSEEGESVNSSEDEDVAEPVDIEGFQLLTQTDSFISDPAVAVDVEKIPIGPVSDSDSENENANENVNDNVSHESEESESTVDSVSAENHASNVNAHPVNEGISSSSYLSVVEVEPVTNIHNELESNATIVTSSSAASSLNSIFPKSLTSFFDDKGTIKALRRVKKRMVKDIKMVYSVQ